MLREALYGSYEYVELGAKERRRKEKVLKHAVKPAEIKRNTTISELVESMRGMSIQARNIGKCPEWHSGAGEPAWLFADEIIIE